MGAFESLAAVALAFLVVTISPGPANIAVATVSMRNGRRAGLRFGSGLAVGLAFWGIVAATGLGVILETSVALLTALKIVGGLYLLWLAWQSARSALTPSSEVQIGSCEGRWFARGLILNLSNPKAVVAWMAALAMGLGNGDSAGFVVTATLVCMVVGGVNYAGYALAFSLPNFMAGYARLRRWIDGAVAGLFTVAGLGLLRSALARSSSSVQTP